MTCRPRIVVDGRDAARIREALLARRAGYAPRWRPRPGGAGTALLDVYADELALLVRGIDGLPDRSRLAFLESVGTALLPAQSARAPLAFTLLETASADIAAPANTRVAATLPVPPPTPARTPPALGTETVVFATEQAIQLTRARLVELYSVDPGGDQVADHVASATTGFELFGDLEPALHAIYFGHDELLQLKGAAELVLSFDVGPIGEDDRRRGLEVTWEFLAEDGWLPFELLEDQTEGFLRRGKVALRRHCGPDTVQATFAGHTSYWIRGRLVTPLPSEQVGGAGRAPELDTIQLQVRFSATDLQADFLFNDLVPLVGTGDFEPFGPQPVELGTFVIGSSEAFARPAARVTITFEMARAGVGTAVLDWQFYDGRDWKPLTDYGLVDTTDSLQNDIGKISFACPQDWNEAEYRGQLSHWLRARITTGDYGHPLQLKVVDDGSGNQSVVLDDSTLHQPRIGKLRLGYTYVTDPEAFDHCLTYNDFVFTDATEASRAPRSRLTPFVPLSDTDPAVYFGFDQMLPPGLCGMYVYVPWDPDAAPTAASPYTWEYLSARGWAQLGVLDETAGFRQSGMIQLIGPPDPVAAAAPGGDRYLVRARLQRGETMTATAVTGVWWNAVWATQRESVDVDILGQSDGNPGQTFDLVRLAGSVLDRIAVEVREWAGKGRDWEEALQGLGEDDYRLVSDPATGEVREVWTAWSEVAHFHESAAGDRHFVVERAEGRIGFGDGAHGMIPPAGSRVTAAYDTGGGAQGNLAAGAINQLQNAIPLIQSALNPAPAAGGAEVESTDMVAQRGAQSIRHMDRAVTEADYEWIARDESAAVARARGRGLLGPDGSAQRGWVTVQIVPRGIDPQPEATPELLRRIRERLVARAPATVGGSIRVVGTTYVPVSVVIDVVPRVADQAVLLESDLREALDAFLHPVSGGPSQSGWDFGEAVHVSQIAAVVAGLDAIDHVSELRLLVDQRMCADVVEVPADAVVAPGKHVIRLTIEESAR